jgi:hypothetical protein
MPSRPVREIQLESSPSPVRERGSGGEASEGRASGRAWPLETICPSKPHPRPLSLTGEGGRKAGRESLTGALLLLLLLAGCGTVKSPTETGDTPGDVPAFTFSQIQAQIFTPTCAKAGCHAGSTGGQEGLILDAGVSYNLLVNHAASENSTLDRVEPGDPDRSYLILKLRGDPSISGARMPFDGPPYLSSQQIEGIAAWIRAGAPND